MLQLIIIVLVLLANYIIFLYSSYPFVFITLFCCMVCSYNYECLYRCAVSIEFEL